MLIIILLVIFLLILIKFLPISTVLIIGLIFGIIVFIWLRFKRGSNGNGSGGFFSKILGLFKKD